LVLVVLVSAPPELCTIPDRGSSVAASLVDVEVVWVSSELCTIPERGSDVDDADDADSVVELEDSVCESGDEVDDEADGSDVEPGEDVSESPVSARATHGEVATAEPIPSATANAPTRPIYFALPIVVPSLETALTAAVYDGSESGMLATASAEMSCHCVPLR
jgi:hypothetical protein